ncbi:hypothetical protein OFC05_27890, partial [Escherichia coli]|nr:hypothetical protein [Escherichia coli]
GARLDAQVGTLHGSGRALSQGDLRLAVSGAFQHTGELAANGTLALHAGALANHGRIQAGEQLLLQAASLDNSARGDVNAPTASVQVRDTLTN